MEKLQAIIKQFSSVAVALSGGPDSALILREAAAALGANHVIAITAQTGCLPERRLFVAKKAAQLAGVAHKALPVDTLSLESAIYDEEARCGHCRRLALQNILDDAWLLGCDAVIDGRHLDDAETAAFKIADTLQITSPYLLCGIGEGQSKMLRGDMQLEAILPGDACLYSRFAPGMPIQEELVFSIDHAEEQLRNAGYIHTQIHISANGENAFIVVPEAGLEKAGEHWSVIMQTLEDAGIRKKTELISASRFFD